MLLHKPRKAVGEIFPFLMDTIMVIPVSKNGIEKSTTSLRLGVIFSEVNTISALWSWICLIRPFHSPVPWIRRINSNWHTIIISYFLYYASSDKSCWPPMDRIWSYLIQEFLRRYWIPSLFLSKKIIQFYWKQLHFFVLQCWCQTIGESVSYWSATLGNPLGLSQTLFSED